MIKKSFALFLGIPLLVTVAVYALHVPDSFVGLDIKVYDRVLSPNAFGDTALQVLLDVEGKVVAGYYAPLSSLSLMADTLLGEKGVADARITNAIQVILHCLNGVLVFVLFRLLSVKPLTALIASSIFLVHPLQVTAVMWFAERKTLLATFFFLITYITFVQYRRTSARSYYVVSLISFLLGLLSKPVVVMFPVLAFVGDLLELHSQPPRTQQSLGTDSSRGDSRYSFLVRRVQQILPALLPFVLEAIGLGVLAISTEPTDHSSLPLLHRPFVALTALWFYVDKILLPIGLMYIYPKWSIDFLSIWCWLPAVLTASVVPILVRFRERIGSLVWWALACFVVMLLPTLGFFTFGTLKHTLVANYFCYLSLMGGGLLIALAAESLLVSTRPVIRIFTAVLLIGYGVALVGQTNEQAEIWSNPVKLWNDNVERCPECWVPHQLLGTALLEAGQPANAIEQFRSAIELKQDDHISYYLLGEALMRTGNLSEAEKNFRHSIQLRQDDPAPYNNMGNLMRARGETAQAIQFYLQALEISPHNAMLHNNLGTMMLQTGNVTEAILAFERALSLKPRFAKAHANLGFGLLKVNRVDDAEAHLIIATGLDPNLAAAQNALGRIMMAKGAFASAVVHLRMALRTQPDFADAQTNLELALQRHHAEQDREKGK